MQGSRSFSIHSIILLFATVIIFNHLPVTSFLLPCRWRNSQICSSNFARMAITTGTSSLETDAVTADDRNPLVQLGLPQPILLGSASFTRKLILKEMNIPFHKVVRPIDEKSLGDRSQDPPDQLVLTLANAKMDHLVTELQAGRIGKDELPFQSNDQSEWILLTGDQVVTCEGAILEKPESMEEAKHFVGQYGRHPPSTVGSCVLHHVPSNIRVSGVDTATIYFDTERLTASAAEKLVDALVEQGEPIMSCAGGLMIEHPQVQDIVLRIDGTQDSVMGLSKPLVDQLLKEMAQKLKEV
jgi:septum formation protein